MSILITMFVLGLTSVGLVLVLGIYALYLAVQRPVEGYEDETGFHPTNVPLSSPSDFIKDGVSA
jgi:hypothetical protein